MANAPTNREPPIPPSPDTDDVFQRVVHAANVAYYLWMPETGELYASPGLLALFGRDPATMTPQAFLDAMHPDDIGPYREAQRAHFKSGAERMEVTWRVRVPDGTYKWARELSTLERDSTGRVIRVTATVTDITEAKQREADLQAALERQTAMSEILRVISASPGDLTPVFQSVLNWAVGLTGAEYGDMYVCDGERFAQVAHHKAPPAYVAYRQQHPLSSTPGSTSRRVLDGEDVIHIADIRAEEIYRRGDASRRAAADLAGMRTVLQVALRKDTALLGILVIYRTEVSPFTQQQITLLQSFAAQAVIAMENARLLTEQREALERQTAVAEVLRVINTNPGNLAPVFGELLGKAMRLCGAAFGSLYTYDGTQYRSAAQRGVPPAYAAYRAQNPPTGTAGAEATRTRATKKTVHIEDMSGIPAYLEGHPGIRAMVDLGGARTVLAVPLLKDDAYIGYVSIYRQEVRPFADKQIMLLENFAAQAVIAMENARLLTEQREALERQTATSEVLAAINASPGDLQPVFESMLEKCLRLCDSAFGFLRTYDGTFLHTVATRNVAPEFVELLSQPARAEPGTVRERMVQGEDIVHIADLMSLPLDQADNRALARFAAIGGARTALWVALRRDGVLRGIFNIFRHESRPFTDTQIALVRDFAAQAVIAMDNARLLEELRQRTVDLQESLDYQTAISAVLRTISEAAEDPQPVFEAIVTHAARLCDANVTNVTRLEGEQCRAMATASTFPEFAAVRDQTFALDRRSVAGRVVMGRATIQIEDLAAEPDYEMAEILHRLGVRTALGVPLLRDGVPIGTIGLGRTRKELFTEKQVALVQTFADQAVIALENARLLSELRERTEALAERNTQFGERIDQQNATIDVLKVMSTSPGDPQPVFDLIADRARTFAQADAASVITLDDKMLSLRAYSGQFHDITNAYQTTFPRPVGADSAVGRAVLTGGPVLIDDTETDREYGLARTSATIGLRAVVAVPILRGGMAIGAVTLARRTPGRFSEAQSELLRTFAEQAAIAITSAETYRELQARTEALALRNSEYGERIEQQSATIDVLKVMSASPDDPQPVFQLIAERATEFCQMDGTSIMLVDNGMVHLQAMAGRLKEVAAEYGSLFPRPIDNSFAGGRAIRSCEFVEIEDLGADQAHSYRVLMSGLSIRSAAAVPMFRAGLPIGAITVGRTRAGKMSPAQVELLETYAEQAVIAITSAENHRTLQARTAELARSLSEQQEALEQQKASAEILNVISTSVADPQPVFKKILESCTLLFGGDELDVLLVDDQGMLQVASYLGKATDIVLPTFPAPWEITPAAPAIRDLRVAHYPDVMNNPDTPRILRRLGEAIGIHSMAFAPLIWEGRGIGVIGVARPHAAFADRDLAILQGFADQAVIAIQNARMFREVRDARDTAESTLADLRRAQDRLVQSEKMASLGQLTAGIAHEIKNPLNFVNNFSDLSADLLDELNGILGPVEQGVDAKLREEIEDLTTTLKGNLAKIAEHGRRADSIVKNMLAHSRTGASERRAVDLNATAEEALNLAYHGARAETPGFNIILDKQFDPNIGMVDLYPQEFTRVLVNLINNGFYAAHKRAKTAKATFEPTLSLITRAQNGEVEIRVRDNGTGIPEEVREKIFEPFFTTKPAGEGTGLGLSLSYDIIVKQHGGQLRVESEPDAFTEFTITLPRRTELKTGETT